MTGHSLIKSALSRSAPRNPRCNGEVENQNKSMKNHILRKAMANGYSKLKHKTYAWTDLVHEEIATHNRGEIKIYGQNVTPFLLLRGRHAEAADAHLDANDWQALWDDCGERLQKRADDSKDIELPEPYPPGTVVRVYAFQNAKRSNPMADGPFTSRALVVSEKTPYYKVSHYINF